jgi:mannitol/fructose-specific phosphotransferase system IIA component
MGYQGVTAVEHHSAGELGVDIGPFFRVGDFGERTYYAVQVKVGNISATATHASSVATVMNQAQVAITKRFLDVDHSWRNLDRLFIITSGTTTVDAKAVLSDYLQDQRRVMFLDGERVLELLQRYGLLSLLEKGPRQIRIVPLAIRRAEGRINWEGILKVALREGLRLAPNVVRRLLARILDRERIMATTVGKGFALPHTYDTGIGRDEILLCAAERRFRWTGWIRTGVEFSVVCLIHRSECDSTGEVRRVVASALGEQMGVSRTIALDERLAGLGSRIEQALRAASFAVQILEPRVIRVLD